ncbi:MULTISPECIES: hypothetical protein [Streptomyces]|nr:MULTISPECIES: hypothetical protein [Streptomyces]
MLTVWPDKRPWGVDPELLIGNGQFTHESCEGRIGRIRSGFHL